MPVKRGKDKTGPYYQWGTEGKKYYFTAKNTKQRKQAKALAALQGEGVYKGGAPG